MDLKGGWSGVYEYMSHFQGAKTGFRLTILEESETDFNGTVEDDVATGGHPDQGTIKGRKLGDGRITFVKEMPRILTTHPNGRQQIVDGLYQIHYEGAFVAGGSLKGRWKIRPFVNWSGGMPVLYFSNAGTWEMWRSSTS